MKSRRFPPASCCDRFAEQGLVAWGVQSRRRYLVHCHLPTPDDEVSHTRAVQAKLQENPSLKVVNSYAIVNRNPNGSASTKVHIFTALAA